MLNSSFIAACLAVFVGGFAMTLATSAHAADKATAGSVLRHVVIVKFKGDASSEQVQEVVDAFRALPSKIDTIQGFEYGTDNSPEMKAAGFTHCFLLTFADEKGRDVYLPHPAHEAFKQLAGPRFENVLVVDYWTKK